MQIHSSGDYCLLTWNADSCSQPSQSPPPPSCSFQKPKSTPSCVTTFPHPLTLHTPKPPLTTVSWFQMELAQPERRKKKKRPVWVGQGVPASRKCFSVPPSYCGAWLPAKDGVWAGSPQREVGGHWGFWGSPHTSQPETSAEIVKAGLVADLFIHFLLWWSIGRWAGTKEISIQVKMESHDKAQQRHLRFSPTSRYLPWCSKRSEFDI